MDQATARSERWGGKRSLGIVDGDNLHRAKIRSILGTWFEIRRGPALTYLPIQPECFYDLAECIVRILLKETRAGIPAGTTADAS